jgi:hypothetical protein
MRNWLLTTREPKTTSLGGAIRYTLRIWSRLTAFVDAPEVWLDNNVETPGRKRGIATMASAGRPNRMTSPRP